MRPSDEAESAPLLSESGSMKRLSSHHFSYTSLSCLWPVRGPAAHFFSSLFTCTPVYVLTEWRECPWHFQLPLLWDSLIWAHVLAKKSASFMATCKTLFSEHFLHTLAAVNRKMDVIAQPIHRSHSRWSHVVLLLWQLTGECSLQPPLSSLVRSSFHKSYKQLFSVWHFRTLMPQVCDWVFVQHVSESCSK